jgi:hypothetical protein
MCGEPESDHEADLAGTDQSAPNGPLKRLEPLIDRGTHSADDGRDWFPVVDERSGARKAKPRKMEASLDAGISNAQSLGGRWRVDQKVVSRSRPFRRVDVS